MNAPTEQTEAQDDGPMGADFTGKLLDWTQDRNEEYRAEIESLRAQLEAARGESERLQLMVNDLQSGMYINCVYCGHRYGPSPDTPVSMADVLKAHVEQCPKHPMSALRTEVLAWRAAWATFRRRYPYQRPPELMAAAEIHNKPPC